MTIKGVSSASSGPGSEVAEEIPLDPERLIVDPHHHLWDFSPPFWKTFYPDGRPPPPQFLLPQLLETIDRSGHKISHTVAVECHAMYRSEGPRELRPTGETEFLNGIAAMSASGTYGASRLVAGIVGAADLCLGERVKGVLEAQIAAGNGRLRGIRESVGYAEIGLLGLPADTSRKGVMTDAVFRRGVAALASLGLSFDVFCVHTQIQELGSLAAACPQATIILDHLGGPLNFGPYAGREKEVFEHWSKSITDLAQQPNVFVKLGGLGTDHAVSLGTHVGYESSETLSEKWRPYIETCIEAFGVDRCMFESNFPPDSATCSYGALWNAFKRIAAGYSEEEKNALFSRTATTVYRLQ